MQDRVNHLPGAALNSIALLPPTPPPANASGDRGISAAIRAIHNRDWSLTDNWTDWTRMHARSEDRHGFNASGIACFTGMGRLARTAPGRRSKR